MPKSVELSNLNKSEQEAILQVIQRDFALRKNEDHRLEKLNKTSKLKIQSSDPSKCVACGSSFFWLVNPKILCSICQNFYCKSKPNCGDADETSDFTFPRCALCRKSRDIELMSHEWYYSQLKNRFRRHGGAKILRELYKKRHEGLESPRSFRIPSENPESSTASCNESYKDDGAVLSEKETFIHPDVGAEIEKAVNKLLLPKLQELKDSHKRMTRKEKHNQTIDGLLEKFLQQASQTQSPPDCAGDLNSTQSSLCRDAETMTEMSDSDFESFPSRTGSIRSRASFRTLPERMQNLSPESLGNLLNSQQEKEKRIKKTRGASSKEEMVARAEVNAAMAQIFDTYGHDLEDNQTQEFSTELNIKALTQDEGCQFSSSRRHSSLEDSEIHPQSSSLKTLAHTEWSSGSEKRKPDVHKTSSSMDESSESTYPQSRNDSFSDESDIIITAVNVGGKRSPDHANSFSSDSSSSKSPKGLGNPYNVSSINLRSNNSATFEDDSPQLHVSQNNTCSFELEETQDEHKRSEETNRKPMGAFNWSTFSVEHNKHTDSSSESSSDDSDSDQSNLAKDKTIGEHKDKNEEPEAPTGSSTSSFRDEPGLNAINQSVAKNHLTTNTDTDSYFRNVDTEVQSKTFSLQKEQRDQGEANFVLIDHSIQAKRRVSHSESSNSSTTSSNNPTLEDERNVPMLLRRKLAFKVDGPSDISNIGQESLESSQCSDENISSRFNLRNQANANNANTSNPTNSFIPKVHSVGKSLTSQQNTSSSSSDDDSNFIITRASISANNEVDPPINTNATAFEDISYQRQKKSIDDVLKHLQSAGLSAKKVKFNRASLNSPSLTKKSANKTQPNLKQIDNASEAKPEKLVEWEHYSFIVDPGNKETQRSFTKNTNSIESIKEYSYPTPTIAQRRSFFSDKQNTLHHSGPQPLPSTSSEASKERFHRRKETSNSVSNYLTTATRSTEATSSPITDQSLPTVMTIGSNAASTQGFSEATSQKITDQENRSNICFEPPKLHNLNQRHNLSSTENQSLKSTTTQSITSSSTSSFSNSSDDEEDIITSDVSSNKSSIQLPESNIRKHLLRKSWHGSNEHNFQCKVMSEGTATSPRILKRSHSSNSTENLAFIRGFIEIEKANSPNNSFRASSSSLDKRYISDQTTSLTTEAQMFPSISTQPSYRYSASDQHLNLTTSSETLDAYRQPKPTPDVSFPKVMESDNVHQHENKSRSKKQKPKKKSLSSQKISGKIIKNQEEPTRKSNRRNPFVIEI